MKTNKGIREYLNLHSIDDDDDGGDDDDVLPIVVAVRGEAQAFAIYIYRYTYLTCGHPNQQHYKDMTRRFPT